jgi:hypothetical protein
MRSVLVCACIVLAGCFDFVEPDLPESGAPVVLQAATHLTETGRLHFTATLAPALSLEGFLRRVPNDTIVVHGIRLSPDSLARNGSRYYDETRVLPELLGRPLLLAAPRVPEVVAQAPAVRWESVRALADTIVVAANQDLVLRVQLVGTPSDPQPQQRQWAVDLVAEDFVFRIGADGAPPDSIRIPSYWIPTDRDGQIDAYLTYFLSGIYRPPPGDFVTILTADTRIRWTVHVAAPR